MKTWRPEGPEVVLWFLCMENKECTPKGAPSIAGGAWFCLEQRPLPPSCHLLVLWPWVQVLVPGMDTARSSDITPQCVLRFEAPGTKEVFVNDMDKNVKKQSSTEQI